jgi:hypothetical protein
MLREQFRIDGEPFSIDRETLGYASRSSRIDKERRRIDGETLSIISRSRSISNVAFSVEKERLGSHREQIRFDDGSPWIHREQQ